MAATFCAACTAQSPTPQAPPPPPPPGHASGQHGAANHHGHHHGGAGHDGSSGPLVHRFEHAEEWTREFDDPARDAWQKPADVIASMHIKEGMAVADIGAGTGYFEPWLSRAVGASGSVLALDVEPDMVRYLGERIARERLTNTRAAVVGGDDPKLSPGSLDRILIVDTWHHIPGREAYAAKLSAGLKSGGQVFIVDFTLEAKHGPPPELRLKPEDVIKELTAGGLRASLVEETLPEQYIIVGARP